jgi:hypothetical protein
MLAAMRHVRGKIAARQPAHASGDAAERGDDAAADQPSERQAQNQRKPGRDQTQPPAVLAGGAHGVESGILPGGAHLADLSEPLAQDLSGRGALSREANEIVIGRDQPVQPLLSALQRIGQSGEEALNAPVLGSGAFQSFGNSFQCIELSARGRSVSRIARGKETRGRGIAGMKGLDQAD